MLIYCCYVCWTFSIFSICVRSRCGLIVSFFSRFLIVCKYRSVSFSRLKSLLVIKSRYINSFICVLMLESFSVMVIFIRFFRRLLILNIVVRICSICFVIFIIVSFSSVRIFLCSVVKFFFV